MDLSNVPPAAQHEIATATIIWLWEIVARVDLPEAEAIPEASDYASGGTLADQPPRWRLPDTGIVITRVDEGPRAGEFLFSPKTFASARSYAELARVLALIWLVLLVARWIPEALIAAPGRNTERADASLIRWVARVFALFAVLGLVFAAAQDLGIPVYGLVAGAGVGGLAIALAARPTLENFIGALNLFADRPIRVGDLCRFDERHGQGWNPIGTVEAIGLRSTKIRQFDRSLITIPNADLAERNIVNLSACETFLLQQRLPLRYETSADQLRYLLATLREVLHAHPMTIHTEESPIRARFLGFRDQALTLELRAYLRTTSYTEFLAIQEDIMLRVMQAIQQAGTGFALPAQTLYMARDSGLDADARTAAEQRVREWAAAHELPFPDMDEAQRKRITDTLDYPPEGSPGG